MSFFTTIRKSIHPTKRFWRPIPNPPEIRSSQLKATAPRPANLRDLPTLRARFRRATARLSAHPGITTYRRLRARARSRSIWWRTLLSRVGGWESTRFPDHLGFSEATPKGAGRALFQQMLRLTLDAGDGDNEAGAGGAGWE